MLDTIEKCNERLSEIDSRLEELQLLYLEREYVIDRRKILEKMNLDLPKKPVLSGKQRDRTLSPQLLKIIKDNSGISTHEIREFIDDSYSDTQIRLRLADMCRRGDIENNNGRQGKLGIWSVKKHNTRKDHILKIIANNPGLNGRGIYKKLSTSDSMRQITFSISDMRKRGLIENRGGTANGARWYIKEADADQ